jgi:hypothetical protein
MGGNMQLLRYLPCTANHFTVRYTTGWKAKNIHLCGSADGGVTWILLPSSWVNHLLLSSLFVSTADTYSAFRLIASTGYADRLWTRLVGI